MKDIGKDAESIGVPAVYGICQPMCFGGVAEPDKCSSNNVLLQTVCRARNVSSVISVLLLTGMYTCIRIFFG